MNNEDNFSKLFRDTSNNIEESPSADVWNRLESRLDKLMPVSSSSSESGGAKTKLGHSSGRTFSLTRRWMVAASLVVMVFLAVGIVRMLDNRNNDLSQLAENSPERNNAVLEDVVLDESLPIAALTEKEQEHLLAQADKAQADLMLDEGNVEKPTDKISAVEKNITLKENNEDVISIEIEPTNAGTSAANTSTTSNTANAFGMTSVSPNASYNKTPELRRDAGNIVETNNAVLNYAENVPSVNNALSYDDIQQMDKWDDYKALEDAKRKQTSREPQARTNDQQKTKDIVLQSKSGTSNRSGADVTGNANTSQYDLHNRLQIFEWLIGTWKDTKQYAGTSYEEWTVKDPYTLLGKGYVVNESKNTRLFQEQIRITYNKDLRQVYLITSLDGNGKEVDYMLTGYDESTGEYIFQQADYAEYPERVILKQDSKTGGFATIIVDKSMKKNTLNIEQQRYLDNRNHVSGERSIRNLSRVNSY